MFSDEPSEHEPEVDDPGAEAEDVEFDVTTGEDLVDRLPDESEASTEVRRTFWVILLLLDFGLFAVPIGLLLVYLWGWTERGGVLALAGLVALASAYLRIQRFRRSRDDSD